MIFPRFSHRSSVTQKLHPKTCGSQLANTPKMDEMTLVSSRWVTIPTWLGVAVAWFAAIFTVQYHKAINSEWVSFPNLY